VRRVLLYDSGGKPLPPPPPVRLAEHVEAAEERMATELNEAMYGVGPEERVRELRASVLGGCGKVPKPRTLSGLEAAITGGRS